VVKKERKILNIYLYKYAGIYFRKIGMDEKVTMKRGNIE
jgi:hypothetical protein